MRFVSCSNRVPALCVAVALVIVQAQAAARTTAPAAAPNAVPLAPAASAPALPPPVKEALARAGIAASGLSVVAYPLERPGAGLRIQADRAMQPGSTIKLLTAAVALQRLGPNARGHTELLALEAVREGVLDGPLYLRGGADEGLDWGVLWGLLRELRDLGLREIRGGFVIDRERFQPTRPELGQTPFDDTPEQPYNTVPDALYLNGGLLDIELNSESGSLQARSLPGWPGIQLRTEAMQLDDTPCKDWAAGWQTPLLQLDAGPGFAIALQGRFPRHCRQRLSINTVERQRLASLALRALWQELGGTVSGEDREGATPEGAQVLAQHQGRPLSELMRGMLKRSDNPLARLLFQQLAPPLLPGLPVVDSQAAAEAVVREWLRQQNIAAEDLVLDNGSGLSRTARIRAETLAAVLERQWRSPLAPEWLSALPIAGEDGTLRLRLRDSPARGQARLKTGTLRNALGLAGYVRDASGQPWVLVALLNDERASERGRPVLDALVDWLARQP